MYRLHVTLPRLSDGFDSRISHPFDDNWNGNKLLRLKRLRLLALLLVVPFLTLTGTTVPAFAACGSSSHTGDSTDGSWTKDYNPQCSGQNEGSITVTWHNTTDVYGHRLVKYDISLWAGNLYSSNCIEGALDWAPKEANDLGHSDAQIMRNCNDYTTKNMTTQVIDTDEFCVSEGLCSTAQWPLQRLQVSTFGGGQVFNQSCPGSVAPLTENQTDCDNWHPDAVFSSVAAKIRTRSTSGVDSQNNPQWPGTYDIKYQLSFSK